MLLDIVEFTRACSQLTAPEVLVWMRRVRGTVEDTLMQHGLHLIETRGTAPLSSLPFHRTRCLRPAQASLASIRFCWHAMASKKSFFACIRALACIRACVGE